MVLHIILADILLIARFFPRSLGARKNITQLAKYPRVLYVKHSNKIYLLHVCYINFKELKPSLNVSVKAAQELILF